MLVYHATEKDCVGEDQEPQECVICFEEFDEGDEMGRLECLCKFHRVSLCTHHLQPTVTKKMIRLASGNGGTPKAWAVVQPISFTTSIYFGAVLALTIITYGRNISTLLRFTTDGVSPLFRMKTALLDGNFGFWKGVWWFIPYKIPPRIHRDTSDAVDSLNSIFIMNSCMKLRFACDSIVQTNYLTLMDIFTMREEFESRKANIGQNRTLTMILPQ